MRPATLRQHLVDGLDREDRLVAIDGLIINERLASEFFNGEDPIRAAAPLRAARKRRQASYVADSRFQAVRRSCVGRPDLVQP
jgi:hypothetical protein